MSALEPTTAPSKAQTTLAESPARDEYAALREAMVRTQIEQRGVRDERVLEAMRVVPRHRFFPGRPESAYFDFPQMIACQQTISQPYIVALMTEALQLTGNENVLEIGAGSGYQSAVLSLLSNSVTAIERHANLADGARAILTELEISNVTIHIADGSQGHDLRAPYDAILVAAAAPDVPPALVGQLAPGGRMVLPIGPEHARQKLVVVTKDVAGVVSRRDISDVSFVPLVGAAGYGLPDDLGIVDI